MVSARELGRLLVNGSIGWQNIKSLQILLLITVKVSISRQLQQVFYPNVGLQRCVSWGARGGASRPSSTVAKCRKVGQTVGHGARESATMFSVTFF